MPLPVDYKIDKIFKKIQEEIKEELNIEVSLTTIESIVNQQIKSTIKGMSTGDTVIWKYFGKFVATQQRVDGLNRIYKRKGKVPTLIDNGYHRISLDRKGDKTSEGEFTPAKKRDFLFDREGNRLY